MTGIRACAVSGAKWRERFSDYARYAVMTSRGYRMRGAFTQEYATVGAAVEDMKPGDSLVILPIAIDLNGNRRNSLPKNRKNFGGTENKLT